jgi:hypothetical protein
MCSCPEKKTCVLGYTLTGDLPFTNTFSQNRNNKESPLPKCSGYLYVSQNSTSNKFPIYKTVLKPVWTYVIQLWGTASTFDIEILECFQLKVLCMIVDTSWYVLNRVIQRNLQTPTVKEEICRYSSQYSARLSAHAKDLLEQLLYKRRLWRHLPDNMPTRFLI